MYFLSRTAGPTPFRDSLMSIHVQHSFLGSFTKGETAKGETESLCTNEGRDRDLNKHKLVLNPLDEPRKGETAKGETETKSLAKGETSRLSRP